MGKLWFPVLAIKTSIKDSAWSSSRCNNNNNNNNNNNKTGDRNVIKKEAEKILRYKDITIEIQCMWNVKTNVIPVIIGATGIISKSFRKYVATYQETMKSRNYRKQPY